MTNKVTTNNNTTQDCESIAQTTEPRSSSRYQADKYRSRRVRLFLPVLVVVFSLLVAPSASAIDYSSQYFNGATDYNVNHWSEKYFSRGFESWLSWLWNILNLL